MSPDGNFSGVVVEATPPVPDKSDALTEANEMAMGLLWLWILLLLCCCCCCGLCLFLLARRKPKPKYGDELNVLDLLAAPPPPPPPLLPEAWLTVPRRLLPTVEPPMLGALLADNELIVPRRLLPVEYMPPSLESVPVAPPQAEPMDLSVPRRQLSAVETTGSERSSCTTVVTSQVTSSTSSIIWSTNEPTWTQREFNLGEEITSMPIDRTRISVSDVAFAV